jgi:hypothetical protein
VAKGGPAAHASADPTGIRAWTAPDTRLRRQRQCEGNPRLDANGEPIFNQIIEFADRAPADCFRAMVLELNRREHPEAIDDRGAP